MNALAVAIVLAATAPDAGALPSLEAPAAAGRVEKAFVRVLQAPHADPSWFAPNFLAKVPIPATVLDGPLRSIRESLGALRSVVAAPTGYRADYERGSMDVDAKLDDAGRFTGLFLHPPMPLPQSADEALKAFAALPGKVSVATVVLGKPGPSLAPDEPLAVGSTFKLAVLAGAAPPRRRGGHELGRRRDPR
jgi:hypothetical protein